VNVPDKEDKELKKFFSQVHVGDIKHPAVILDSWGRIMAWHLPDIIASGRVVCPVPVFRTTYT
jgi:hypothetical protein